MSSNLLQKFRSVLSSLSGLRIAALILTQPVLLSSVLVTALLIGVQHLGYLQALELSAFDQLIQLRPDEGPDSRLLVVAITEEDLQKYGTPIDNTISIPDNTLDRLLQKLEQDQPRVIGLDIFRDIPVGQGRADLVKRLQQSDRTVVTYSESYQPPPGIPKDRLGFADADVQKDPRNSREKIRRYLLLTPSITAKGRNSPPQVEPLCNSFRTSYSLGLQLALHYLKGIQANCTSSPENYLKIGATIFRPLETNSGGFQGINAGGYQLLLNYRSRDRSVEQVTLTEALKGRIDKVRNRVVLIGYTARSKGDIYYTPYSIGLQLNQKMPGVIIHAQMVSQILSAVLDNRPLFWFWTEWSEAMWIWGWSLVGGSLAWRTRHSLFLVITGGAALGAIFGICYGLFTIGGWVPLVPSALALVATGGSVVAITYREVPMTRSAVVLLQRLSRSADSH